MVTIIKQSGSPVNESEAKKFLDEWREGFDKLFEAGGDMPTVTEEAKKFEEKLLKKYKKKESAISYAKKHINFKYIEQNKNSKNEYFLDDEEYRAVGIIIGPLPKKKR